MHDANALDPAPRPLADSSARFLRGYNRFSFLFRHGLGGHPLFELRSLARLSRRMSAHAGCTTWSNGAVDMAGCDCPLRPRQSLQDSIIDIAGNDSQVRLMHVERDAVFGPVLAPVLTEVSRLSGRRLRDDMTTGCATILISSPTRRLRNEVALAPKFVLQLAGDGDLGVFDHGDRDLVSDEELELLHAGDRKPTRLGVLRPEDACHYYLRAGLGAHIPAAAPRWSQSRDTVSISLSLDFQLQSVSRAMRVHRANRRLRAIGLNPTPPGVSPWIDAAKIACADSIASVQRMISVCTRSNTGRDEQAPG